MFIIDKFQKPSVISREVNLLWLSFVILVFNILKDTTYLYSQGPSLFTFFFLAAIYSLLAFLIYLISAKKGWARYIYLIVILGELKFDFQGIGIEFARSPLTVVLYFTILVIDCYAMWLLFSNPANAWFATGR